MTNFLNRNVFKKILRLTNYAFIYRRKCVCDVTEFRLLCLSRPVPRNALVSFHEICGDPLEKTVSNSQVVYDIVSYCTELQKSSEEL